MGLAVLSLAAILSLTCGILHGRSAGRDRKDGASQFVKLRPPPLTARLRERLAGERPFSLPVARDTRSDDAERTCGLKKTALLETNPVSPYSTAT